METYIVRIHRRQEEGESPVSIGIVENAENGRKTKFADSKGLLRILKLKKIETSGNNKPKRQKGGK
jgi:hypothetical protein